MYASRSLESSSAATPLAVAEEERVAGEQEAVLAAVPQVRGRARRVARGRDHLEVVVEHVAPQNVARTCVLRLGLARASAACTNSGAAEPSSRRTRPRGSG